MRKTVYDIAKEANVGVSTVSRVLNNRGYVSDEMRAKVEAAAEGYTPRSTRAADKAIKIIALVISHDPNYFFVNDTYLQALMAISTTAKNKGYHVLLDVGNSESKTLELLDDKQVEGVILMGVRKSGNLIPALIERGTAFVLIGDYLGKAGVFNKIEINDAEMAEQAVRHLITLGHEKIGFISGSLEYASCQHRFTGYQKALEAAGVPFRQEYVAMHDGITEEKAYNLAKKLLYDADRITAVLAFNDSVAVAVYKAAREMGLSIPQDLSVIGFDDSNLARSITPGLTTVWQPSFEKGERAAEMLIENLNAPGTPKQCVNLNGILIYRDSCAPPREEGESFTAPNRN